MNLVRPIASILLLVPVISCASSTGSAHEPLVTLTGHYIGEFERQEFISCDPDKGKRFWVENPERVGDMKSSTSRPALITIQAVVKSEGMYGHLGAYADAVDIKSAAKAKGKSCI